MSFDVETSPAERIEWRLTSTGFEDSSQGGSQGPSKKGSLTIRSEKEVVAICNDDG